MSVSIDPWASWHVTCSWACHAAAHNSDLGTDFAAAVGTPIVAAFDGTLRNVVRQESPTLNIAYLTADIASSIEFEHMHLSRFAPAGHYEQGQTIGWSGGKVGAPGSGHATGPHLHVNAVINGVLASIFDGFTALAEASTSLASVGDITAIPQPSGDENMRLIYNATTGHIARLGGPGGAYDLGKRDALPTSEEDFFNFANGTTTVTCTDTQFQYAMKVATAGYTAQSAAPAVAIDYTALAATLAKVIPAAPTKITGTLS